jgi:hypothetical protein
MWRAACDSTRTCVPWPLEEAVPARRINKCADICFHTPYSVLRTAPLNRGTGRIVSSSRWRVATKMEGGRCARGGGSEGKPTMRAKRVTAHKPPTRESGLFGSRRAELMIISGGWQEQAWPVWVAHGRCNIMARRPSPPPGWCMR